MTTTGKLPAEHAQAVTAAKAVAALISRKLSAPYDLVFGGRSEALPYRCSASLGITVFGREDQDPDALIVQADKQMYEAKKGRR